MDECSYLLFEFAEHLCFISLALFTDVCFACVLYHNHNFIQYTGIKTKLLT